MGYTHYFTLSKNTTESQKEKMVRFTNKAIELFGIELIANSMGNEGTKPEVTEEVISLNGLEDNSHETFILKFNSGKWQFCKTAMKPYDTLVVACLIFARKNNVISEWSSDGEGKDNQAGKELFEKVIETLRTKKQQQ